MRIVAQSYCHKLLENRHKVSRSKLEKPDKICNESNKKFYLPSLIHYPEVSVINLALRDKSLNPELSLRVNLGEEIMITVQTDYRWPYCLGIVTLGHDDMIELRKIHKNLLR